MTADRLLEDARAKRLNGILRPFHRGPGESPWDVVDVRKSYAGSFGVGGPGIAGGFVFGPRLAGEDEISLPYMQSWVVFACVRKWIEAVRSVPLQVFPDDSEDAEPLEQGHPLVDLIARPNRDMDWPGFIEATIAHRLLDGEDFVFLVDELGRPLLGGSQEPGRALIAETAQVLLPMPRAMVPVQGSCVREGSRDQYGCVAAWSYLASGGGELGWWAPDAVLRQHDYNPLDGNRGFGRSDVLRRKLNIAFQAERYQESMTRTGGLGGFLMTEADLGEFEERRMQQELDARTEAPGAGTRLKILSGSKWSAQPNPVKPDEMRGQEAEAATAEAVCCVFDVPPPVIGIFKDATYNNVGEAFRQFWNNVCGELRAWERGFNERLLARLQHKGLARCRVRFDFSGVEALKPNLGDIITKAADAAGAGVGVSFDEAMRRQGADVDTEDGAPSSVAWMNPTLVPAEGMPSADEARARRTAQDAAAARLAAAPPQAPQGKPGQPGAQEPGAEGGKALKRYRHPPLRSSSSRKYYAERFFAEVREEDEARMTAKVLAWQRAYQGAIFSVLDELGEDGPQLRADGAAKTISGDLEAELAKLQAQFEDLLRSASSASLRSVYAKSLAWTAAEFSGSAIPMTNPEVVRALAAQEILLAEGCTSTVAKRVSERLLEVLMRPQATSVSELQLELRSVLPELRGAVRAAFGDKEARALCIARTETGHASATARVQQLKTEGCDRIQWLSSHDSQVRETHADYDGQVRKLGVEEFAPGLRWPRDTEGSAGEVINCRCEFLGVVDELQGEGLPAVPEGILPVEFEGNPLMRIPIGGAA